jgi:hypothetical protein
MKRLVRVAAALLGLLVSTGVVADVTGVLTPPGGAGGGGSGVSSVSVVGANGLGGTVANATTTPAITLTTSITGPLKGNGTAVQAASSSDLLGLFPSSLIPTTDLSGLATVATSGSASDLTGTLACAQQPAYTGDVTVPTGTCAATIAAGAVTLAKQANLAANSIQCNNTGSPGVPLACTVAQTKTLLAIASTDVSGLGTLATQSGTFSGNSSGTNTGDQTITLTGDCTGSGTGSFATTCTSSGGNKLPYTLSQTGLPMIVPPSGFMTAAGVVTLGQAPPNAQTVSFSGTSGSVTMTFSAATLAGTSAGDVGRVLTILDTTYKYATITAFSSTTVATATLTGTLSGTGPFANNAIWLTGPGASSNVTGASPATISAGAISGTAGQFTGTVTGLVVGQYLTISGTFGGTGSITGYANPTTYYVSATDGATSFTLQTPQRAAIVTTVGTPTGLTYTPVMVYSAPLTAVYANSYDYFPASSPVGSAGWYFCQWATTTVGTCFTSPNSPPYTSGTPTIPGSTSAFSGLTPAAYTQTPGNNQAGVTVSLPGNALGARGALKINIVILGNNSSGAKIANVLYSATTILNTLAVISNSVLPATGAIIMRNAGVTNAQAASVVTTSGTSLATAVTTAAIDSTSAQNVIIKEYVQTQPTDWEVLAGYDMLVAPN